MPFDWNGYLELAETLTKVEANESALRTAISRAYYSAYNQAFEYVTEQDPAAISTRDSAHKQLWQWFSNKGRSYAAIAQKGNQLRVLRQKADYNQPELTQPLDTAKQSITYAQTLLHWLRQLKRDSA